MTKIIIDENRFKSAVSFISDELKHKVIGDRDYFYDLKVKETFKNISKEDLERYSYYFLKVIGIEIEKNKPVKSIFDDCKELYGSED